MWYRVQWLGELGVGVPCSLSLSHSLLLCSALSQQEVLWSKKTQTRARVGAEENRMRPKRRPLTPRSSHSELPLLCPTPRARAASRWYVDDSFTSSLLAPKTQNGLQSRCAGHGEHWEPKGVVAHRLRRGRRRARIRRLRRRRSVDRCVRVGRVGVAVR